jgi:hypothetical protein
VCCFLLFFPSEEFGLFPLLKFASCIALGNWQVVFRLIVLTTSYLVVFARTNEVYDYRAVYEETAGLMVNDPVLRTHKVIC